MVGDHRVKQVQQCQVTRRCNLVSLHIKQQKLCQSEKADKMVDRLTELCRCFIDLSKKTKKKIILFPICLHMREFFCTFAVAIFVRIYMREKIVLKAEKNMEVRVWLGSDLGVKGK